jgi:phosphate transport system substrate-binding protein
VELYDRRQGDVSMKNLISALSAMLLVALTACGGGERSATTDTTATGAAGSDKPLTIKGSDTMVIMTQRLSEAYMKAKPGTVVQVNGGGSGTGIAALINGTVDLAQASRPMKNEEKQHVEQGRGAKVVETAVALDSLAVFVNSGNPVRELTLAQVGEIFKGKITDWKEVGGKPGRIVLYGRESSSGTYDYFKEHVLDKQDFAAAVQTLQGTAAIVNAVGADANGIGYGGIAYAKNIRAIGLKKDAASAAIEPSEATVADGTYPLSRKLFFYSLENAPEKVTGFVQWCLTPEAQSLVKEVGYFPIADAQGGAEAPASPNAGTT